MEKCLKLVFRPKLGKDLHFGEKWIKIVRTIGLSIDLGHRSHSPGTLGYRLISHFFLFICEFGKILALESSKVLRI